MMMLQTGCSHWSCQSLISGLVLPQLPEPETGQVIHQIVHDAGKDNVMVSDDVSDLGEAILALAAS